MSTTGDRGLKEFAKLICFLEAHLKLVTRDIQRAWQQTVSIFVDEGNILLYMLWKQNYLKCLTHICSLALTGSHLNLRGARGA